MDLSGLLNSAEEEYGVDDVQSAGSPYHVTSGNGGESQEQVGGSDSEQLQQGGGQQDHHYHHQQDSNTAVAPLHEASVALLSLPSIAQSTSNTLPPSNNLLDQDSTSFATKTTSSTTTSHALPLQTSSNSLEALPPIAATGSSSSLSQLSPSLTGGIVQQPQSATTVSSSTGKKKHPLTKKKKAATSTLAAPASSSAAALLAAQAAAAPTTLSAALSQAAHGHHSSTATIAGPSSSSLQPSSLQPASGVIATAGGGASSSATAAAAASNSIPAPGDPAYVDPDWVEDTEAVIAEADAELLHHPQLINPYLARLAVNNAHTRNSNLHAYSSSSTASLISSANHITQWAGATLSAIMDTESNPNPDPEFLIELQKQNDAQAAQTSSSSSSGGGPAGTIAPTDIGTAAGGVTYIEGQPPIEETAEETQQRLELEEADKINKLEKKKASAREGWKKRRQNQEERERLAWLEAQALGMNEEDAANHVANSTATNWGKTKAAQQATASTPTITTSDGALPTGSLSGELASSPAPSVYAGTVATKKGGRRKSQKNAVSAAQSAAALLPPIPGSLTHENGFHPSVVGSAENGHGNNGTVPASSLDGHSQNGDDTAPAAQSVSTTIAGRKRAVSSESASTAHGANHTAATEAKRPRLADEGIVSEDSPLVKVEHSDAVMGDDATASSTPLVAGQQEISVPPLQASLPPHMRSSPAPGGLSMQYSDSDRQPSPALSAADSSIGRNGGKSGSMQPKERERLTGTALQEAERKIWASIARSNIPKIIKYHQQGISSRQVFNRRIAGAAAREAKKYNSKHPKAPKDVAIKARRVMRELLLHLKGSEKTARENKRKQEKEQLEKARKEEEQREAQRQARKLNFLITQTELYSHFVGSKLKTDEMEDSAETAGSSISRPPPPPEANLIDSIAKSGPGEAAPTSISAIDFDDEERLASLARANAQAALDQARNKTKMFDTAYQAEQQNSKENYMYDEEEEKLNGGDTAAKNVTEAGADPSLAKVNLDDLNFQNPQMAGDVEILKQPNMLTCQLKEYQLKGLNWLANLYEQGINGILADEMGLGKTVQSISLMAYLAENHNIWGPFLVVAPASTLHNWQQELAKFTPQLKVLPYWGNVKDRTILRKFWNRKSLRYDQNAPFHVLITSYQLVVTDEQYFNKVKWQYMVLDEAQAIKSSASARWKILLGLNCRNRLLLTGTPIQNSMQELWALLHFIMPSLFDSHNEFSDWFSKDIEGNADKSGGMNEHQLRRLHMILKPFMLRRIKKNVQNELADKIEIDLYCDLTPRQRQMYRTLRQNISISDLVKRASSLSDDDSVKRLMNLIMQFRKVCNHPELFERADVTAPFAFCQFPQNYNLSREGTNLNVQYSTHSLLEVKMPRVLYDDPPMPQLQETSYLTSLMNIYTGQNIEESAQHDSVFTFEKFSGLTPRQMRILARSGNPLDRMAVAAEDKENCDIAAMQDKISGLPSRRLAIRGRRTLPDDPSWRYLGLPPLGRIQEEYRDYSRLNRSDVRFYVDPAQAPPADLLCSSRSFAYKQSDARFDENVRAALYGTPGESTGVIGSLNPSQLPLAPMEVPQLHKLILDSGKLAKLDELLGQLKAGGHRVLVYFQMTRMIDLMEEYLAFRQYKYLRLDGSSTISERRDMVTDWQTKPEYFIFLLSTRAGGLGINLTAADTVVFYDSDWNPSNDVQAMDRAHRLGQTRQVTVYRLITKGTIDERILQLARTKKSVQDAVVGSSTQAVTPTGDIGSNEVVNLLLDDDELEESMRQKEARREMQEAKSINNGKKGAKAREINKKAKEIAASAKSSGFNSTNGWGGEDDDDDAFGFFSNTPAKKFKDPDEDAEGMGGGDDETGEAGVGGAPANGAPAKGKGKGSRSKPKGNPDDPDAPPAKKRKPAVKKETSEQELGPDGEPLKKKRGGGGWPKGKPRGKKLATQVTTGSFNPGAPAALSAAASTGVSTAADSSAAPTPSSSAF